MGWAGEGQGTVGVKLCRDCKHAAVNSGEPEGLRLPCAMAPAAVTLFDARHEVCRGELWERAGAPPLP